MFKKPLIVSGVLLALAVSTASQAAPTGQGVFDRRLSQVQSLVAKEYSACMNDRTKDSPSCNNYTDCESLKRYILSDKILQDPVCYGHSVRCDRVIDFFKNDVAEITTTGRGEQVICKVTPKDTTLEAGGFMFSKASS